MPIRQHLCIGFGFYTHHLQRPDLSGNRRGCHGWGKTIDISLEKEVLPYISRWTTVGNNEVVSLYLNDTGTYNFWADYGDGTPRVHVTSPTDPDAEHTYATPGTHTITITGLCTGMDGSDVYGISQASGRTYQNQLIEVVDLGNVGWQTFSGLFYRAGNLTDVSGGDTSRVTNMGNMFAWATNATPDTSGWIVDNVTQMGNHVFWRPEVPIPMSRVGM